MIHKKIRALYDVLPSLENLASHHKNALRSKLSKTMYCLTYPEYYMKNELIIEGSEILAELPDKNVMFVSNHETYFGEAGAILGILLYSSPHSLFQPKTNLKYIAAEETMKMGWFSRLLMNVGNCIPIKRQFRDQGADTSRGFDVSAAKEVLKALKQGWLLNFPTGTTSNNANVRLGTASYIKKTKSIVVPITISGFESCFGKKGIISKSFGNKLKVKFHSPLEIDYDDSREVITEQIEHKIGAPNK